MSEQQVAKEIKAELVKNSGRGYKKGDMIWGQEFLVDVKEGKSFALNESAWNKVCEDANSHGGHYLQPMFIRVLPNGQKLVILDLEYFEWIWKRSMNG